MRDYYVYILCNESGTLYTGDGFTKRYNISRLVYYETFSDIRDAIGREKQIKSWRRSKKLDLIVSANPRWQDLAAEWFVDASGRTGVRPPSLRSG